MPDTLASERLPTCAPSHSLAYPLTWALLSSSPGFSAHPLPGIGRYVPGQAVPPGLVAAWGAYLVPAEDVRLASLREGGDGPGGGPRWVGAHWSRMIFRGGRAGMGRVGGARWAGLGARCPAKTVGTCVISFAGCNGRMATHALPGREGERAPALRPARAHASDTESRPTAKM